MANDWWARKLGGNPPPPPPPPGSTAAPYAPPPLPPPQQQQNLTPAQQESAFQHAMATWRGTTQAQQGMRRCPDCGSGNYYSPDGGGPMRMAPAARCYDCGYPVVQAGSSRGGANVARSSGEAQPARQLPSNHAVTVVDAGGTHTFD